MGDGRQQPENGKGLGFASARSARRFRDHFAPDGPIEALHVSRRIESCCWRIHAASPSFTGAPGTSNRSPAVLQQKSDHSPRPSPACLIRRSITSKRHWSAQFLVRLDSSHFIAGRAASNHRHSYRIVTVPSRERRSFALAEFLPQRCFLLRPVPHPRCQAKGFTQ
jgi:hypothetical protein